MHNRFWLSSLMAWLFVMSVNAQWATPVEQMEQLDRGVVVVAGQSGGRFVSWRLLATDPAGITFDVVRDGTVVASNLTTATSFLDSGGSTTSTYQVVARAGGQVVETSAANHSWADLYTSLQLDRPDGGTTTSGDYTYTPNDMSVGDVDGDGQYELFVKWDPSNSSDNASGAFTGNCIIDCYRLDGTRLWRVDLGSNIRSGAHYTQFMVYDFDGDGRAEMMCKTAPGSLDGQGNYVTAAATETAITGADNTASYITTSDGKSKGMILSGPEYLTVFNGLTGAAQHTIWYNPNRAGNYGQADDHPTDGNFWGDNYGNRGDRFLAAVAHLDKGARTASGIFCRGYYARAYVWAVDYKNQRLSHRWLHCSDSKTTYSVTDASFTKKSYTGQKSTFTAASGETACSSGTLYGNGNHNLSIADVDGDGKDEIIWGSAACDDNGRLLYGVGFGHGDAIHLADLLPDRPGLEVFDVHEEKGTYAWDLHDACTGEVLLKGGPAGVDNGRGLAAHVDANYRESFFSSAADGWSDSSNVNIIYFPTRNCATGELMSKYGPKVNNFRIYWDGDLLEEYLGDMARHNQPFLEKWNGNGCTRMYPKSKTNLYSIANSMTCNDTKGTPCLQADILGDWREEVIFYDGSDPSRINIFTTNVPTDYRVPTLMHDHVYRMGIAWQNTSYNQPPHLGFFLPDYIEAVEHGTTEAADTLVTVLAQDYEQAVDASAWSFTPVVTRGELSLQTDDSQGNYVQYAVGLVNSTPVYSLVSSGCDSYTLEFDAAFSSGNTDASEFVVATEGGKMTPAKSADINYQTYNNGLHMLMHLDIPAKGTTATINTDETQTAKLADGSWYHYRLKVDGRERTVGYTVAMKSTGGVVASGTYELPDGTTSTRLQGFYYLAGRYYATMKIDNIMVKVDRGDANGDGLVDGADLRQVVNHILGRSSGTFLRPAADVNGDGKVSVADVVKLVDLIIREETETGEVSDDPATGPANARSSESHPSSLGNGRVVTDEGKANARGSKVTLQE